MILRGERPDWPEGNLLLDYLAGAQISFLPQEEWGSHESFAQNLQEHYVASGDKAHFIPIGASDEIGLWGYIAAFEELAEDFKTHAIEPDYIITATGSGLSLIHI